MNNCPIEKISMNENAIHLALNIISGKWRLKILWEIYTNKVIRFNQLQKNLDGISNLMLTRCLKELLEYKLVDRKQFNEVPPHVEYSLTDLGMSLCPILRSLEKFGYDVINQTRNN
ncbi:transcriptional regulator, HxlR family [Clostridium cavendishii DSM 21758]|uniref:Transcriptional regulator, HxlR family n=1 Tax=Clostridium cavendishii DSM 21758 TaxID=1121302 RepID=A0A1M6DD69_9CLOT|nr:helix-turn-helix domain-containing protein [Clostridium cavendishii]SHI71095.1 transcriptional regulator, HxlR family [Clostridium cavendishii DSM 21758]